MSEPRAEKTRNTHPVISGYCHYAVGPEKASWNLTTFSHFDWDLELEHSSSGSKFVTLCCDPG